MRQKLIDQVTAASRVSRGGVWVPGGPPGLQNRWTARRAAGSGSAAGQRRVSRYDLLAYLGTGQPAEQAPAAAGGAV